MVARLGYLAVIGIIATLGVAVVMALRPDTATHHPPIAFEDVVKYGKTGDVESIEVRGRTMIVRFREGFDAAAALGQESRTFEAAVPAGGDVIELLEAAGVPVGEGGLRVTVR